MNKTVAFVVIGSLAGLIIAGAIILTIHRPDATATFISQMVNLVGIIITAAGTLYGLGKVGEKVDAVQKQTNGTLTKRDDEIAALRAEKDQLVIAVAEFQAAEKRRPNAGDHRA